MIKLVLALAAAGLALLAWVFWRDVLLLWPLLLPLIKTLWAKASLLILAFAGKGFVAGSIGELLGLLGRRFLRWVPSKAARSAAMIFVPPAARGTLRRARQAIMNGFIRLNALGDRLPGGIFGLTLSLIATTLVAAVAFVYFGLQAVVVFKYVPEAAWSALSWLWAYAITFLFRFSMWRGLTRGCGHVWDRYTPMPLQARFKRLRRRALRHAIHKRQGLLRAAARRRRAATARPP